MLLPLPWLRGLDGELRMLVDWRDPAVRRIFVLMLPVSLGLGLINFNLVVDTFFAARFMDRELAPGLDRRRFPHLHAPAGDLLGRDRDRALPRALASGGAERRRRVPGAPSRSGLRQIGFTLVPASAVGAALCIPITRLLYERGAFTADQTVVVAEAFAAFSLGLTFNGAMLMLNRAFFSMQKPWLPTWIALGSLAANVALDWAFASFGVWGIPLATSVVNIGATAALVAVLRRRVGSIDGGAVASSYARIVAASALTAGVAYAVWWGLDALIGRSLGAQLVTVTFAIAAATVAYLVLARLLGIRELGALLSLVGGSGRRSGGRRRR